MEKRGNFWEALSGWLLDHRLVVILLAVLLCGAGLLVAPFDWNQSDTASAQLPVDAIPNTGENQQIVFTEWPGRSPRDVEQQVTYPLTTALLGVPGVRATRSASAYGFSTIQLIFSDDTDFYWARSRVLEKLASLPAGTTPSGVTPTLGPDATALGQVFWYTLEARDENGRTVSGWDPDELRSLQDWTVRYALQSVEGVSEVASIGGFVREYQVDVDPEAMRSAAVAITDIAKAVSESNLDTSARTLEINRVEYVVRGVGLVESSADIEAIVVRVRDGTPIRVADLAKVAVGPAARRGVLDDEGGPAVGGVVVARYDENPKAVIDRVKRRIEKLQESLPKRQLSDGTTAQVTIVPFYDRSELIGETIETLETALVQQVLIAAIVVLLLMRDLRSAALISSMLPIGVLATLVIMKVGDVGANIMALGGIAIAIGTMVDLAIIFVENIERALSEAQSSVSRAGVVGKAAAEVAPAVLTSVLTTIVSFLPVLGLPDAELRLFAPLVFTKTFAMVAAFLLSLLVLPSITLLVLRDRPTRETSVLRQLFKAKHLRDWLLLGLGVWAVVVLPVAGILLVCMAGYRLARPHLRADVVRVASRVERIVVLCVLVWLLTRMWSPLGFGAGWFANVLFVAALVGGLLASLMLFQRAYPRLLRLFLRRKLLFLALPAMLIASGTLAWRSLGSENMPPFDEGAFLYMPVTLPHASIGATQEMLSQMDASIAQIPEVDRVVGKAGRVDSALDPAPLAMFETLITYKPKFAYRDGKRIRQWRPHIHSPQDIWREIVAAADIPGITEAPPLQPIETRLVMLQSGMRARMGVRISGTSSPTVEAFALDLERLMKLRAKEIPAVNKDSVFAERSEGKPYLEIRIDRESLGRYGLTVGQVQDALKIGLGGEILTTAIDGVARYPIRVRYMRGTRDDVTALGALPLRSGEGAAIQLSDVASIVFVKGPAVIKSEDTRPTTYVTFGRSEFADDTETVAQVQSLIRRGIDTGELNVPTGVTYEFAGSYQRQQQSEKRLLMLVPLALVLVFIVLYLQFKRVTTVIVIYLGVVVAASGGFLILWLYGQPWFLDFSLFGVDMRDVFAVDSVKMSVATWIGIIALIGIATDDGVVMATYLEQQFGRHRAADQDTVRAWVVAAGKKRIRACIMTTATTIIALFPVITSSGRGADVMLPMALPVIGGMMIEVLTLFVVPVLYCQFAEWRSLPSRASSK